MSQETIELKIKDNQLVFIPDPCQVAQNAQPMIFWKAADESIVAIIGVSINKWPYLPPIPVDSKTWQVEDKNLEKQTYKYVVEVLLTSGKTLLVDPEIQNMGRGGMETY